MVLLAASEAAALTVQLERAAKGAVVTGSDVRILTMRTKSRSSSLPFALLNFWLLRKSLVVKMPSLPSSKDFRSSSW